MINFKNKRELTFFAIGILMLVLVLWLLISSISFLAGELNSNLSSEKIGVSAGIKFNIEKVKDIKKI